MLPTLIGATEATYIQTLMVELPRQLKHLKQLDEDIEGTCLLVHCYFYARLQLHLSDGLYILPGCVVAALYYSTSSSSSSSSSSSNNTVCTDSDINTCLAYPRTGTLQQLRALTTVFRNLMLMLKKKSVARSAKILAHHGRLFVETFTKQWVPYLERHINTHFKCINSVIKPLQKGTRQMQVQHSIPYDYVYCMSYTFARAS